MASIKEFLTQDHRACDEYFAQMEQSVADKSVDALEKFEHFQTMMLHHFGMEEEVMFPAFEVKTGMRQGPTEVMRREHDQMRMVMMQMHEAIKIKDTNRFFGLSETLMIVIQQHNMKEEQMLYTMAEQHLGSEADKIIEEMKAL